MRITIFFVLLFCSLQEVQGSKSTKKNGHNRLMTWAKKGAIILALNYSLNKVDDAKSPTSIASHSNCKYIVPDQNAAVMMEYIVCSKQPEFEKYLVDNSEDCSNVKALYEKVKNVAKCALNIPKTIVNGALTRLKGKQSNQDDNVKMLREHLQTNSELDDSDISSFQLGEGFDFFQFVRVLDLTKIMSDAHAKQLAQYGYQQSRSRVEKKAVQAALDNKYKDVDVDHAKRMLELTRLRWPGNDRMAVTDALSNEYKDVDVDHAKQMLELTRLEWPENESVAVAEAMENRYKNVNVEHTKRMLELTRLRWPGDESMAVSTALSKIYTNADVDHVKRMLELTRLLYPDNERMAVGTAMITSYKDVDVDQAKRMLRLTNILFPDYPRLAVYEAMKLKYKAVEFKKVDDKYKALKNSKSWYDYWYSTSDKDYMERALELTYPEIVKEDF